MQKHFFLTCFIARDAHNVKNQLQGLDISQAFFDATGIALNRYREIVFVMLTPLLGQSQEQLIGPQNLTLFQLARMIRDTTLQSDESQTMIENEAEEKSSSCLLYRPEALPGDPCAPLPACACETAVTGAPSIMTSDGVIMA